MTPGTVCARALPFRRAAQRTDLLASISLSPLDLAALLCSRVCHDVISPVGAIINGLEVLESEKTEDMRAVAMELIKKSAESASARLQYCRLAFGASGSLNAAIDTGDAEHVAKGLLSNDRTKLEWNVARRLEPKTTVKLLLNMCLIAAAAAPRGGTIAVDLQGEGEATAIQVTAKGPNARLSHTAANFLSAGSADAVDAHSIQLHYTTLLAEQCGMAIEVAQAPESVILTAKRPSQPGIAAAVEALPDSENSAAL